MVLIHIDISSVEASSQKLQELTGNERISLSRHTVSETNQNRLLCENHFAINIADKTDNRPRTTTILTLI